MQQSTTVVARLEGARKRYGAVTALDGIDLSIRSGELLAVLGRNGAGKSTAVGLLLGLIAADGGTATVFGESPERRDVRWRIGAMLQSAGIPERLKVGELLEMVRSYYPSPRSVADCVALAGLDGLLDRRYGRLSGGQQRRVQFAMAICGRPRLLFLDEPTTGLDIEARQAMWKAIRELVAEGSAVLMTTHYLEEAEALADRVVVIDAGRVVADGTVTEIRSHVSQRRIRCVTTIDADVVADWPGVIDARREGDALLIDSHAAEPIVRRLLDGDAGLHDLEIQRAGLADAFLEITRQPEQESAR